jgi:ComF family protein
MKRGKGLSGPEREYCGDCRKHSHKFERGRSLYQYESAAGSIYRFKYQGRQEYADFFAEELYQYLGRDIQMMRAEAIIPVPLHRSRLKERGYNQSEVLARALSKRCGIPVLDNLAVRCKKTIPQKQLNYAERQNNLKKAFKICANDVKLNTVIIMDDIYTTGSTVDALAEALLCKGVKHVFVVTLAAGVE